MENPFVLTYKTPTKKDFLDTTDFEQSELLDILKVSTAVRDYLKSGHTLNTLYHQTLAMLFEQQSTRTRVAFEVGMEQLGGHALNLAPHMSQLGTHETLGDTATVLSRLCDFIVARVNHHASLLELASRSNAPVINGMSDYNHPTQELSDFMTILDHLPEGKPWNQTKIVFVGDCTQVCASLMMITTKMGMNFVQYSPPSKWLSDDFLKLGRANCQTYGGSVHVTDNPAYLEGADFVYTDVWYGPYYQEVPREIYLREFYPKYQVNDELLALTGNPNVKFMHCLPANRNEEVADNVFDGPHSIVWDGVENQLAVARGLLLYLSGKAQTVLDEIKEKEKEK